MPTFRSIISYRRSLNARIKALGKIDSPKKAAQFLQNTAKKLAPKKTGETIRGIRRRKTKKQTWIVESRVLRKGVTGFMQNFWTNRTAPHRRPRMFWNKDSKGKARPTLYGDGSHRITGLPRWFHFATLRTIPKFKKLTRASTRKALRIKVGG